MKNFFGILFIIILYPINPVLANDEIIKVYYSGFSFSNTYESNVAYAKYTSSLVKEINVDTGIDIISSLANTGLIGYNIIINKIPKKFFIS
jgi:hypothetical protein